MEREPQDKRTVSWDCLSCQEDLPKNSCQKSERPCGHHCNHTWTHDSCCWCGEIFGDEDYEKCKGRVMKLERWLKVISESEFFGYYEPTALAATEYFNSLAKEALEDK